jgi:hypothetical protein
MIAKRSRSSATSSLTRSSPGSRRTCRPTSDARSPEQHARWLNAQLLEFHRREKKAFWWEYFHRAELGDDELIEDRATLGGLSTRASSSR